MQIRRSLSLSALVLVLLIAVLSLAWGILQKPNLDKSSGELALEIATQLLETGSTQALRPHAHASLLADSNFASTTRAVENIRMRLGQPLSFETIVGSAEIPLVPLPDAAISARYEVDLIYEHTVGTATIEMLYELDEWKITRFSFASDLLLP